MDSETDILIFNHVLSIERNLFPCAPSNVDHWIALVRAACDLSDDEQLPEYRRTIDGAYAAGLGNGNFVLARLTRTLIVCDVSVLTALPASLSITLDTEASSPEFNFEQTIRHVLRFASLGFAEE